MTNAEKVMAFRDGLLTFGEDMEFEALYTKADGTSRFIHVKPGYVDRDHYKVKRSADNLNYVEYDMVRDAIRSFRLDRLSNISILGVEFTSNDIIALAP